MAQKAKKVEVPVMEEGAILKASIKERGITQVELADRILVLCGGKVSGILDGRKTDKREIGLLMTRIGGEESNG